MLRCRWFFLFRVLTFDFPGCFSATYYRIFIAFLAHESTSVRPSIGLLRMTIVHLSKDVIAEFPK